ncbi:MAG: porin family protein [Gemmatimonadetes bacterium]|nr:porin family protein [Gemmatimonadota bacterium]
MSVRPFARALLVSLALLTPVAVRAQVRLEVTPYFASYYSTIDLRFVDASNVERQAAGPGAGATVTWRFNNIWAVEGQTAVIQSGVMVKNTGFVNFEPPTEGRLTLTSARLLFQPRRTNLYVMAGVGRVTRSGAAWDVQGFDGLTSTAMIVGFGVRTRVSPTWGFRLGTEMHLYDTNIDGASAYYDARQQRDVLVTIGVPIPLIGR